MIAGMAGALAALIVVAVMTQVLLRKPVVGVVLSSLPLLFQWDFPVESALVSLGGVALYYGDLVAVAFLFVAIVNLINSARFTATLALVLILLILIAIGVLRGVSEHEPGATFNEARAFAHPFIALFWAATVNWQGAATKIQLVRIALIMSALLTALAAYHAVRYGFTFATNQFIEVNGASQNQRILTQLQALALSLALFIVLLNHRRTPGVHFVFWISMTVILASQQRTVWLTLLAGLAVIAAVNLPKQFSKISPISVSIYLLLMPLLLLPIVSLAPRLLQSVSDTATFDARVSGWEQLLAQNSGFSIYDAILGVPFGAGYQRIESNGLVVEYSPHNWFVSIYLRLGIIGLVIFCVLLLAIFWHTLRHKPELAAYPIAIVTFLLTYGLSWTVVPLLVAYLSNGLAGPEDSLIDEPIRRRKTAKPLSGAKYRAVSLRS